MAGFKVQKQNASAFAVDDLGITLAGASLSIIDLTNISPVDVARSADLQALVSSGDILIVDARDDSDTTILSLADSLQAITNHNDTHFGISGGRFGGLDDPTLTITDDYIIQYDAGGDVMEMVDPATIITTNQEVIEDIVGGMGVNGTNTTFVYTDNGAAAGTIQWNVDDVFLMNTGDTLDSGTLTIASGATVDFPTGSSITIAGDVTAATIETPAGGFANDNDLINKLYVDSIAGGLDWKESVRFATDQALSTSLVFVDNGGVGDTLTWDSTAETVDGVSFTGVPATGLDVGDRVLVKDQADATQNGIYTVTSGPAGGVTLTRATDQDGSPSNEISGGNTVFVEETGIGTETNKNTVWSVIWDGEVTVNTDPIDWSQTAGPGSISAGIGLSQSSNVVDLDVDDLVAATPVVTDSIAFHDADGAAEASGSQTRKATFQDLFSDLDVAFGISGTGVVVKTADGSPDTYATRTLAVDGAGALDGLALTNADGVSGNPTFGLDINGLPVRSDAVDTTDRVAVYNITSGANEYYTISEIAGAVSASDSFTTWAGAGNTTGDASIVADSSADTATLTGGDGVNIDFTAATDTVIFSLSRAGLADTAVVSTDTVPFFDASNSNEPEYRSWADIITDLNLTTSGVTDAFGLVTGGDGGTATAIGTDTLTVNGTGINVTATNGGAGADTLDLVMDIADLADGNPSTIATGDEVAVNDGGTTVRFTWQDVIDDLGLLVSGSDFYWEPITLTGNQAGDATVNPATAGDTLTFNGGAGITLTGSDAGDSVSFAFSRAGLSDVATTSGDTVPFFDGSNSNVPEYRSWANIITDLGLNTSSNTFFWGSIITTGNTTGDTTPAADPDVADDNLTFNGGIGINITGTAASDTLSWAFSRDGMADTTVVGTDTISFFDGSNSNEPEYRSFNDIFEDLDVASNISGTGVVVKLTDGPDTYGTKAVAPSTDEDELGATVSNGDGTAGGNILIGVDIVGQTDPDDDMAAADEFLVHDKSEGTGGANRKMTGQNIADGVATILDIATLGFSTFPGDPSPANDQTLLSFTDATRTGSPTLSVESHTFTFSDNSLPNNAWISIGDAVDSESGYIMPLDGMVVGATVHCEDVGGGNTFDIDLYVDAVNTGNAITGLTGANASDSDPTLEFTFTAGQKLRVRATRTAGTGNMGDTVVTLLVRWQA